MGIHQIGGRVKKIEMTDQQLRTIVKHAMINAAMGGVLAENGAMGAPMSTPEFKPLIATLKDSSSAFTKALVEVGAADAFTGNFVGTEVFPSVNAAVVEFVDMTNAAIERRKDQLLPGVRPKTEQWM